MGRAPCCDKANVKKGPWSPEEDAKLKSYIDKHGTGGNWIALPQKIGLKRCGKSCRLRWLNYLRPNIKHGGFSEEEDNIICSLYISIGSRWSIIAAQLPGRTDNDIKNYWNTRLKKKLLGKQRREKNNARGGGKGKHSSSGNGLSRLSLAPPPPPPPLPVLQPIPYSDEQPRLHSHASIRRLLMKLGGKFSSEEDQNHHHHHHHHHHHYPAAIDDDQALLLQPMYNTNPIDQMPLLNATPPASDAPHFDLIGAEMSSAMANEINPQRLQGFEFLYDDLMNRSADWGEMNPWGFAPSASSSDQGFVQESAMEEFAVEKMRYLGT